MALQLDSKEVTVKSIKANKTVGIAKKDTALNSPMSPAHIIRTTPSKECTKQK